MTFSKMLFHHAKGWLPDSIFLSFYHRHRIGRFPNLRHPITFNEKILRRCLYPDPRYVDLTDKLKVRNYVARKVGHRHLIPLIAEPQVFDRAVFDALPAAFVMKANHGSGFVEVIKDKKNISFDELDALAQQWLSTDFYTVTRERHYRTIERRIFFETLLIEAAGKVPADLKFHVFNPRSGTQTIFIAVISDRFEEHPRGDMYDADWNIQNIAIGNYERSAAPAPCPRKLDALLAVARALASDFEYVRVDLYESNDVIYFGELTFTPGAGLFPMLPDKVDYEWGRLF